MPALDFTKLGRLVVVVLWCVPLSGGCGSTPTPAGTPRQPELPLGLRSELRADGFEGAGSRGGKVFAAGLVGHPQRVDDRPGDAVTPTRGQVRKGGGGAVFGTSLFLFAGVTVMAAACTW